MPGPSRRAGLAASLLLFAAPTSAVEIELNGKRFTLADGFTIELAANAPLTERPICVDFDEQGRLYVAESSGSNDDVQKQLEDKPHSILRLEDRDGDGVFDHRTIFADRMMFPEGCEWHDGSLYVAAPPQIWKLTDTDDDGVADEREVWHDGGTLTGCANDLHGPYVGPDGLIYWCKGAFAEQSYNRPGRNPFVTKASHIFRRDPRTGEVEPILTGGMDNPVEVAFTRDGEPILSCTFFQHPAGGNRDGLIHAAYGGVWGKDHGVLAGHPRTGDLMPPLVHLGAAAPCGLTRLEGPGAGELRDETSGAGPSLPAAPLDSPILLACSFNLHKVSRHILHPAGGTFTTTDDDFLVCDDVDFHPTDVIEDPDGSVLVVDTGGWYKLCCPTSQLHKPDVPGAIYRIRRTETNGPTDPRGLRLDWSESVPTADLVARLADDRPVVRNRALVLTAKRGPTAVPNLARVLRESTSDEARRLAVWSLSRIDDPEARAAVRLAFADDDPVVLRSAVRAAGLWRDSQAAEALRPFLRHADLQTRRAAAEALGRIGQADAVPDLLALAGAANDDRFLHHAATFALTEIADPVRTRRALDSEAAGTARAALFALEQMPDGGLRPDDVIPRLDSADPLLREAAIWIVDRHADWSPDVARYLAARVRRPDFSADEADAVRPLLTRFAVLPAVEDLIVSLVADEAAPRQTRRLGLEVMASGRKTLPGPWCDALVEIIETGPLEDVSLAVAAVAAAEQVEGDSDRLRRALRRVAASDRFDEETRLQALRVTAAGTPIEEPSFDFLRGRLTEGPAGARLLAADILVASDLAPDQLQRLARAIPSLGPMELDRVLPAFAKSIDDATGFLLVESLRGSAAAGDFVPEKLQATFAKFGPDVTAAARPLLERPQADQAERLAKLERFLAKVEEGDPRRGQAVFRSDKAACASCHAIGYLGGRVGPDLTGIGRIRTDRDLLEAILYPSASFVRSYEPIAVTTTDGRVFNGVPTENPDSLTLATAPDKSVTISRDEIEEMRPSTTSIMPAGLETQLSPQDLADLIAFLKAAK